MAIDQIITDLPTPPSSGDPLNFRTRADAFVAALVTFVTQLNLFSTQANDMEVNINEKEASAVGAANIASAAANFQGEWTSKGYTLGQSVSSGGTTYMCKLTHATGFAVTDTTYWQPTGLAAIISGSTAKTTPVDADLIGLADSAASFSLKKLTLANLKAMIFGSSALTGVPTAPTATAGANTTQIANAEFVMSKSGAMSALRLLHIQDQRANGVACDTSVAGSWQTRTLNTVVSNTITGASLASNVITLPAGEYYIEAHTTSLFSNSAKAVIYNVSDAVISLNGINAHARNVGDVFDALASTVLKVSGKITLATAKNISLQTRIGTAYAQYNFAGSFGVNEVYSDIKIWKVA